jgi:anti-sigma factor RsiW
MGRPHHLSDDRLLDCYLDEREETTVDPRVAEHLTDCEPCSARYAELIRLLDTARSEAELEADAVFTPDRLRLQQQQIARRIEQTNRSGRVISFPAPMARRTMTVSTARTAPRWIAAAAAAGLFVGVALGASYRWTGVPRPGSARGAATARSSQMAPVAVRINTSQVAADDAFMSELEMALDRPRTRELIAIDALTPRFRETRAAQ